jgi:hypothetical protein
MPPMTPTDWINLGQFGLNAITGLTGGKADERTAQRQQQQDELFRQLQRYNTQLAARSALGTFYTQANRDRALGRQSLLDASPLGAEQALAMQMARARGLSGVAETFQPLMPASADIAGLIRPSSDVLSAFTTPDYRASISPEATARSIAERRKALAGVDPTFQFGSMGDYGLPNLEKEVATYAQGVAADRLGRENLMLDLLNQQMKAASAFGQTTPDGMSMQGVPPTQSSASQPKKTSWWKKVVGTALPIAAAFIPGVGPAASVALQAAAGAAGGALTGGKKGALTGAITGAIGAKTGGLGSAAGQRAATESAKEFTKRAILQPSTLTSTAGKLIGGQTGTVLQAAAPFLGGIKPYDPNAAYTRALPVQAQISKPADFTADILRQAGVSPTAAAPTLGTTFTPSQPYRGAVRPPTFGGPGAAPQGPAVTPRPVPTESTPQLAPELRQMLEQVGRRRSQPNVMYGAAPVGGGGINAAMRAPTTAERVRDYLSPVADVLAAIGMPGARQVSTTVPYSGSPLAQGAPQPFEQVLNTPMGQLMLGATVGSMPRTGATVETSKALMSGFVPAGYLPPSPLGGPSPSQAAQKLLPSSLQALLTGRTPVAALPPGQYNLPAIAPSTQKTQLVVADLLQKIEQYKNDPVAVRALIAQMQPYLRQLGVQ